MSIEKAYDSWANQYDSNKNKTRDLDTVTTIKTLDKYEFERVVELGCGTGKNTRYLLKKAEEIIALDFSSEMLKIATKKIQDIRVDFRKRDLSMDWGVADNYADLITCNLVLEHIKDLRTIFGQVNKTLRENGLFFINELHPFKQYLGSKARFETETGTQKLETFVHHVSEYLNHGLDYGFRLREFSEHFDEGDQSGIPRLIGILFQKQT